MNLKEICRFAKDPQKKHKSWDFSLGFPFHKQYCFHTSYVQPYTFWDVRYLLHGGLFCWEYSLLDHCSGNAFLFNDIVVSHLVWNRVVFICWKLIFFLFKKIYPINSALLLGLYLSSWYYLPLSKIWPSAWKNLSEIWVWQLWSCSGNTQGLMEGGMLNLVSHSILRIEMLRPG